MGYPIKQSGNQRLATLLWRLVGALVFASAGTADASTWHCCWQACMHRRNWVAHVPDVFLDARLRNVPLLFGRFCVGL